MYSEDAKVVPILVSANVGATSDTDAINMANYSKVTVVYTCGAFTGNGTFSFWSGADAASTTTAVPFKHALGGAAIGTAAAGSTVSCDVLGAWALETSTVAITCTTKMVVCEISSSAMTPGENWLTGTIAATAGILHAVAICEPRYSENRSDTALA
jgi:hypothetical protein